MPPALSQQLLLLLLQLPQAHLQQKVGYGLNSTPKSLHRRNIGHLELMHLLKCASTQKRSKYHRMETHFFGGKQIRLNEQLSPCSSSSSSSVNFLVSAASDAASSGTNAAISATTATVAATGNRKRMKATQEVGKKRPPRLCGAAGTNRSERDHRRILDQRDGQVQ
ncbi:hypothetical protein JOB18_000970, partial [Solea senegalensis]